VTIIRLGKRRSAKGTDRIELVKKKKEGQSLANAEQKSDTLSSGRKEWRDGKRAVRKRAKGKMGEKELEAMARVPTNQ